MNLKNLTFVFDNGDRAEIERKYIGEILIDKIRTSIQRTPLSIEKLYEAEIFALEIHKDADKLFSSDLLEEEMTIFERLSRWRDVRSVELCFTENGAEHYENYLVDWADEQEYENENQVTYTSKLGNFYILIKDKPYIFDCFDETLINFDTYMTSMFNMYQE